MDIPYDAIVRLETPERALELIRLCQVAHIAESPRDPALVRRLDWFAALVHQLAQRIVEERVRLSTHQGYRFMKDASHAALTWTDSDAQQRDEACAALIRALATTYAECTRQWTATPP